jgi:large subunit ribosomal protein L11
MIVKLLIDGGNMTPGPAIAQKLGPMGMNLGDIISKVNEATKDFKGMKVPVDLNIDPSTKEFEISVRSPPVSELIKKELNIEKGTGDHKKTVVGNISIEQIIKISKTKLPDMLEKDLKACVKTVVGSCVSLGILVDSKLAAQVCGEIEQGEYDKEIKEEKTVPSEEKKTELDTHFKKITEEQEAILKKEADEKQEAAAKEETEAAEGAAEGEKKEEEPKKDAKK